MSILEVSYRNALHRELSRNYFNHHLSNGTPFDNDWYEQLISNGLISSKQTIKQIRDVTHIQSKGILIPRKKVPQPGDVIASQTFGFWIKLLECNPKIDWKNILFHALKDHFCNNASYWSQAAIDDLLVRLQEVNHLRNRIAHHEPIWKFKAKAHHKTGALIYQAATSPLDSISKMAILNDRLVRFLGWISEDRQTDYLRSHYKKQFDWLVRQEAIDVYKNLKQFQSLPLTSVKRQLNSLVKTQCSLEFIHKGSIATLIVGPV